MKHLAVIGGGIAGLAAAYQLHQLASAAGQPVTITLLESASYWGGKILTDRSEGFVIEGGPDTFLATKPRGVGLCRQLGLEGRLHGTNPEHKNTFVLHRQRLKPLPEGLMNMIPTQFAPMIKTGLLSWPQKARMGLDFLLPPRPMPRNGTGKGHQTDSDESLGQFVSRRLGRAAYERLIEPLMSGIYAGDGDKLSLLSTFPNLRQLELEHGGLIKGALATRYKMAAARAAAMKTAAASGAIGTPGASHGKSRSIFLTPTTGLAEIVDALVNCLQDAGVILRLNTPVQAVQQLENGYRLDLPNAEYLFADGVILAAPAYASGELLQSVDPVLAADLQEIPYVSTATVSLAYRQSDLPRPLHGYGYVIPRREGRRALACTWTSTKFPHRAPAGFALLRVFVGRAGQEDGLPRDEAGLLALAQEELQLTLGITAQPYLTRVFYWDRAMPQYNLGHPARLERIQAAVATHPALALAGNGYRGIGIPDCIHSGEDAARQVWSEVGD